MTTQSIIGPVQIEDRPAQFDNNDFSDNTVQKFTTGHIQNWQSKQIQGLRTDGTRTAYNEKDTMTIKNNGWGIIYIDPATGIRDEDYHHKGWGILRKTDETLINHYRSSVACEFDMISDDPHQTLTMDYTPNRIFKSNYGNLTQNFKLNDPFSTFDSDIWYGAVESNVNTTTSSIASNGTDLVFTGKAATYRSYGHVYTQTKSTFSYPMTIEFDLKKVSTPASGHPQTNLCFFISPDRQSGDFDWKNMVYVAMRVTSKGTYFNVQILDSNGKPYNVVPSGYSSYTTHKWKIDLSLESGKQHMSVSIDVGNGYITKWSGPTSIVSFNDLYLGYVMDVADTTTQTIKSGFCQVYTLKEKEYNNIVGLPVGCTILQDDYTFFNRKSSDGDIPCCVNPPGNLQFITEPDEFYDGSVKAYSTNNVANERRQLTNASSMQEKLDPTKFEMDNGLNKIVTTEDSLMWYIWDFNSNEWIFKDKLTVGTIYSMKFKKLNSEIAKLQLNTPNEITVTLKRAKETFNIEHPNTPIKYSLRNNYEHDGVTTTSPAANTDITMLIQDYCNLYGINNLAAANIATGGNYAGTTSGIVAQGGLDQANISISTSQHYVGTKSIGVYNATLGQGAGYSQTCEVGKTYTTRIYFYASAGLAWQGIAGPTTINLTSISGWQYVDLTYTATATSHVPRLIRNGSAQAGFYWGACITVEGSAIPEGSIDLTTGDIMPRYRMQINQLNTATIKSDSIPPSVMTGIGVYDSNVATEDYNSKVNIANEWRNQTLQRVNIY